MKNFTEIKSVGYEWAKNTIAHNFQRKKIKVKTGGKKNCKAIALLPEKKTENQGAPISPKSSV